MGVWGLARDCGQDHERYFLLVVENYTRYTTVFPSQSEADAHGVLIPWIHNFHCQLSAWFQQDLQNVIAEHGIGLIMEVARTLALRCVYLGFPTDAPPWQFYHLASRRVLTSQAVTFDESVCFYCLTPSPHRVMLPQVCLRSIHPPLVEPLDVSFDTSGPAEGGDPAADDSAATCRSPRLETPPGFPPRPSSPPLQCVAVDSSATGGGNTGGAESGGAGPGGADSGAAGFGGAESGGGGSGGVAYGGTVRPGGGGVVGAPPGGTGGAGAGGTGGAGPVGAGGAGAIGSGGTGTRATSARGAGAVGNGGTGAGGAGAGGALGTGAAGAGGVGARGAGGTGGTGAGGAGTMGIAQRRLFFLPQP
ncbi:unnamed protein product [Closterium sp. NIES-53]